MEGDATKLGPGGIRKTQHRLTRERRQNGESAGQSKPIRKSPRLRGKVQSQPSRTSPRLRKRHNFKPARSSPRTTKAYCGSKREERPRPDHESRTAQVAHDNQPSSIRKRQRTETEEEQPALVTSSPCPPWKRVKRPFQSKQEANIAFWDSLSKVWLTKRALKEFDRRTALPVRPARPARLSQSDLRREAYSERIKHFARHGGPDLCDLTGYSEPVEVNSTIHAMPPNQSTSRTQFKSANTLGGSTLKTSTRKSSAYSRNFEQNLIDHGIYPGNRAQKPNNWEEINDRIAQPRHSLSPSRFSDGAFETFQQTNEEALSEGKVMRTVFPTIAGNAIIPNERDLIFTNLEPLTDGTLVDAKPDYYDGARPEQIDRRIRDELGSVIMPSTLQHAPCLPNLFAEGKGPDGSAAVAKRQACYDSALGARGIHMLQSYGRDGAMYDNNAYTISATYHHDGLLKMYTTHPTQPKTPEVEPEYHMTQLRGWCMTDSAETFRQGASAFRNARDWAKEQRNKLITAVNGKVVNMPIEMSTLKSSSNGMLSPSTIEPTLHESDILADELALSMSTSIPLPSKRLKGGTENRHSKPDQKRRPEASSSKASRRSRGEVTSRRSKRPISTERPVLKRATRLH